jgi:hypothetical protein
MSDDTVVGLTFLVPTFVVWFWFWITRPKGRRHERGPYRHMASVNRARNGFKSRRGDRERR